VFTELNKIDIYIFITSKPPYNTGEPKCCIVWRFRGNKNIDIYFIEFCEHFGSPVLYGGLEVILNKIDIYIFITSKPPYNTGEPKCSQNSIK
jgi:hypothetical protein